MSKILRRPMFRGGGKVSSYGNGIATGLADGGMPSKRGLVDGPGGYAGEFKTGSQVIKEAPGIFNNFKFNKPFFSIPTPEKRMGETRFNLGNFGISPTDLSEALSEDSSYREYLTPEIEEFETETTDTGDTKFKLDDKGNRIPIIKEGRDLSLAETIAISRDAERDTQGMDLVDLGLVKQGEGSSGLSGTDILDERNKTIEGFENPKELKVINTSGDDDITVVNESDLSSIIDNYEELLLKGSSERNEKRLKKARITDASNFGLDLFAKSTKEGATVKSMFGEAAENLASKPSKTEKLLDAQDANQDKIKQAAAMLGIKGEQAQKLYETKLKNQNNSGQLQKAVEYIKSINPGMSNSQALATYQRRPRSLAETIGKYRKEDGAIMKAGIKLAAGEWFLDDYKGEKATDGNVIEGSPATGKENGVYSDAENGIIYTITDEIVTEVQIFKN